MSELWQRLRQARGLAGLTQVEVSKRMQVTRAAVAQWEAKSPEHRTAPQWSRIAQLASLYNVSSQWLLDGTGEGPVEQLPDRAGQAIVRGRELLPSMPHFEMTSLGDKERQIISGPRIEGAEWSTAMVGNAMTPDYLDGDILVMGEAEPLRHGADYVALTSSGPMLRRLMLDGSIGYLLALNDGLVPHEPIKLGKGVKLLGRVLLSARLH